MATPDVIASLIVVDMQAAFVHGKDTSPQMATVLPAVEKQIRSARSAGALVIFLQNDGPPGAVDEPETPGWQLALTPDPQDLVIRKRDDSGFTATNLAAHLAQRHVEGVSICGVMSEMCVAATARDAVRAGLTVVVAHDSHGTYPVRAYADGEDEVAAAQAARAAEWSLGDTVLIPATAADVSFTPSG